MVCDGGGGGGGADDGGGGVRTPARPAAPLTISTAQLSVQRAELPGLKVDLCLYYPVLELQNKLLGFFQIVHRSKCFKTSEVVKKVF